MESLLNFPIVEMSDNAGVPVTTISQALAWLTIAGAALFVILLTALHFLKPKVDSFCWWLANMKSEISVGLMTLAFLSLSFSYLALFIAIRTQVRTIIAQIGLALLLLCVVGSAMGGIFKKSKIHFFNVKFDGFVIIVNYQSNMHDTLFHLFVCLQSSKVYLYRMFEVFGCNANDGG